MIKNILPTFKLVFSTKKYIFLAVVIASLFFIGAITIPSVGALKFALTYSPATLLAKVKALGVIWPFFKANSTIWSRWLVILVSILSGINLAMLIFYLKRRIKLERSVGTGFVGMVVGLLGVGCASCGSVVLSSIFGYTAVTSFLGVLPFHGIEIGVMGLSLLLLSIYLITQKIQNPNSCRI